MYGIHTCLDNIECLYAGAEKPNVSRPSTHKDIQTHQKHVHDSGPVKADGGSSDEGIITSSKRKISRGRALILSDEDEDDDF